MKERERTKSVANGFVWLMIFTTVVTFMPFLIRTLIIKILGSEYAGLSSLFSSLLTVLSVSELGMGDALIYSMYKPAAEKKVDEINKLLFFYRKIYFRIGGVIVLLGCMIIPFLPKLIRGVYPKEINLTVLFVVYLINIAGSYMVFSYCNSIFRSHQTIDIEYKWHSLVILLMYIIQCIILFFTRNYYLYIIFLPIGTISANIVDYALMKKYYPSYAPKGNVEPNFIREFVPNVLGMAIRKLRKVVRNSFDCVVISAFLGLSLLSNYQNYYLFMTVPLFVVSTLQSSVLPDMGNVVALETKEHIYNLVKLYAFLTQILAIVCSSVLLCNYNDVIAWWIGEEFLFDIKVVVLFVIYFYSSCLCFIPDLVRNSTGLWWKGKWIPLVECVTNLVLDIVLVNLIGIKGILIATIISIIFINVFFETNLINKEFFNRGATSDLFDYVKNAFIGMCVVGVNYFLYRNYSVVNIWQILIKVVLCSLTSLVIVMAIYYNDSRMKSIISIIRGLLRKKV